MTNSQKQEYLDKKRWIKSEQAMHDLGGSFNYCTVCEHRSLPIGTPYYNPVPSCKCGYEKRKVEFTCAKAHNKYYHNKHK